MDRGMIELKPSRNFFYDVRDNQIAALWMLLGSTRAFYWVTPSAAQFVFFAVLAVLANTLFSWLSAGGAGQFNLQGLVSYLIWPFIALITGIFLAQRQGLGRLMLVPAILWLNADLNVALIQSALQYFGQSDQLPDWAYEHMPNIFLVLFIWQTVSVMWVFAQKLRWPWWERGLILAGTIAALGVWQLSLSSQPIWKIEEQQVLLPEAVIYAQPRLLDDALSQLQQGVIGETNWYFLGVAGADYQDVFKFEVEQVQRQFDTRFGTIGRSIGLINNQATQVSLPMASRTSIERSLARIGQQMNPDDDVLFLFMTSHGLANMFELANQPIDMQSIDPQWLRESLDRAGIRWRVLVISSCYSGSFIPALQSPDTVIITASAADKTSFGCTNAPEFTYFGEAFFAQAMRRESSLEAAFYAAKKQIRHMEKEQGFERSDPQIRIGSNIALMLPRFEARLFPADQLATDPLAADPSTLGASVAPTIPPTLTPQAQ